MCAESVQCVQEAFTVSAVTAWRPWPLWKRFQVEVGVRWQLLPASKDMTVRQWLWSPEGGITRIGQKLTDARQLPEDTRPAFASDGEYRSRFFWARGAVRIFGLDAGFGIFYA